MRLDNINLQQRLQGAHEYSTTVCEAEPHPTDSVSTTTTSTPDVCRRWRCFEVVVPVARLTTMMTNRRHAAVSPANWHTS